MGSYSVILKLQDTASMVSNAEPTFDVTAKKPESLSHMQMSPYAQEQNAKLRLLQISIKLIYL